MCMSIRPQVSQGIESLTKIPNPSKVTTTKPDPTEPVVDKAFKPKDFSTAKTPSNSDFEPSGEAIKFPEVQVTPEQNDSEAVKTIKELTKSMEGISRTFERWTAMMDRR